VWNEFTDFGAYPAWNPFIRSIHGDVKTGNRIEATLRIPGRDPMVFTPVILAFERNRILQWEGRLLLPGVFTGRHTFRFEPAGPGRTRLVQEEGFSGILVPFFGLDATREGFTSMNSALKSRAERGRP
jgi:hypothetical protein